MGHCFLLCASDATLGCLHGFYFVLVSLVYAGDLCLSVRVLLFVGILLFTCAGLFVHTRSTPCWLFLWRVRVLFVRTCSTPCWVLIVARVAVDCACACIVEFIHERVKTLYESGWTLTLPPLGPSVYGLRWFQITLLLLDFSYKIPWFLLWHS